MILKKEMALCAFEYGNTWPNNPIYFGCFALL